MDFTKAFDTVPHSRLLYKLQWYGIQGKIHKWIANFVTDHSHWVAFNLPQYQCPLECLKRRSLDHYIVSHLY